MKASHHNFKTKQQAVEGDETCVCFASFGPRSFRIGLQRVSKPSTMTLKLTNCGNCTSPGPTEFANFKISGIMLIVIWTFLTSGYVLISRSYRVHCRSQCVCIACTAAGATAGGTHENTPPQRSMPHGPQLHFTPILNFKQSTQAQKKKKKKSVFSLFLSIIYVHFYFIFS